MASHQDARPATDADRAVKAAHRVMWALGDYHTFAKATIWDLGPILVEACGISPGQRVLDVAAGTGNTAIRAARTGAQVVATDLTPENFEAGRREARAQGAELEWMEADAEMLPFDDDEFDVVTSSFGAMFAPNHQAVADQFLSVPARGHDRNAQLHARGARGRLVRRVRALRATTAPRRAPPGTLGKRGARAGVVRRPGGVAGDET